VLVHPDVALPVDLAEGVKVELPDKRLETVMAEELRQRFSLEAFDVRLDDKGIPIFCPLYSKLSSEKKGTLSEQFIMMIDSVREGRRSLKCKKQSPEKMEYSTVVCLQGL